ncbi:MAG: hypothetical protein K2O78_02905, partial [Muribaculaceae bacterium]|nr:hypothetical protein [Muribaculaceae bacterium]
LFDSRTGRATPALRIIASFAEGDAPGGIATLPASSAAPGGFYDLSGRPLVDPHPGTICVDSSGRRLLILR